MPIRILIVDDHAILREGLLALLKDDPALEVIGQAEDGQIAVKMAKLLHPNVVIMDIGLPNLNGVDATRQIIDDDPCTHVIALSAQTDGRSTMQMLDAGATGYVVKSNAFEELRSAIKSVVAGKVYLSPNVTGEVIRNSSSADSIGLVTGYKKLSSREREMLQLISEGLATKEIAHTLSLSVKTVETHRRNIMAKLGVDSVAAMVRYAIREGITSL